MHKTMILPVCLGILLLGIVMIPSVIAEHYPYHLGEDEPITEEFLEEVRQHGKVCELHVGEFERDMCTFRISEQVISLQLGDSHKIKYRELIKDYSSRLGTPVTFEVKVMDPSGKIIQEEIIPYHGNLNIQFPETGLAGDYELILSLYVGAPSGGGKEFVMDWQRHIIFVDAAAQASSGCGQGTVLVDGVCQLAPVESSDGCGAGTVMVNGVCQLAKTGSPFNILSVSTIEPLYIVIGAVAVGGGIVGVVFVVRRGSSGAKTPKPARQDLDDYEEQYLRRQGQRPSRKPAEIRQTPSSCSNCGKPLKPIAKFCGECGTPKP